MRRATIAVGVVLVVLTPDVLTSGQPRVVPPPMLGMPASATPGAVAVFAGGCFWGVQGVFQHVTGVISAVSGYAGGAKSTAHYDEVTTGRTGHAESVRVTFDPKQMSYGRLLQIFFSVAHDPTELNRQGPDVGTQYRSAIFPATPDQARIAETYIAQLNAARVFDAPIVTTIEAGKPFYAAEAFHQDYLARNPTDAYIAINDLPKVDALRRLFPGLYRVAPVLVRPGRRHEMSSEANSAALNRISPPSSIRVASHD